MSARTLTLALAAGAALLALSPAFAAEAPKAARITRTADGHPDLTGTWTNATMTKLERDPKYGEKAFMTDAEAAKLEGDSAAFTAMRNKPSDLTGRIEDIPCSPGFVGTNCGYNAGWIDPGERIMRVDGKPATSFITFPANGRVPPLKAGARPSAPVRQRGGEGEDSGPPAAARPAPGATSAAVQAAGAARTAARSASGPANPENLSLGERCIMSFGSSSGPIMQPQLYNNNYQFVQSKTELGILVEMVHDVKIVHIGAQHRTDGLRPWMGDSIGHWEGDTLVVETTNFPRQQALRGSWENLKVTEKFTRLSPTRLRYQFIVNDPTLWDKDWGGEYEFGPAKGQVYEYACHEGNYAMEGILAGARDEERKAAEAAAKPRADATR